MFPLTLQLALMQRMDGVVDGPGVFREGIYHIAAYFVPAATFAYAILCVMAVWGYLYNARSVGLMHTLPVDRTCLFVTNSLAGLTMVLIPYAVVGALVSIIALGWGFFDLIAVLNTVLVVLFCTLLFFGMGTFCAMLTGHAFVLPAFYLLANFLALVMKVLVTVLASKFLIGVPLSEGTGGLTIFSPVVNLYQCGFGPQEELLPDDTVIWHLRGMWIVALYALAGLAMLAIGWFLYKKRHSESAGDVVAFRWLRPVFRYGVALLSGMSLGLLLYDLLWSEIFQKGNYADPLPMAVCLFLGGLIGYYAASMLLEKSRRVFKKSLPGVGIVAAGAVALCLLASVDVFGLEREIPALDDIESVTLTDRGLDSGPYYMEDNPEQAAALRALHETIIADRDYIRDYVPGWDEEEGKAFYHYIWLTYRLKDGSVLEREYDLWLTEERVGTAGTYDNLLAEFYRDPAVLAESVAVPKGAALEDIDVLCDYMEGFYVNANDHADGDDRETRQIYDALQKDAAQGSIPAWDVLEHYNYARTKLKSFYLRVNYRTFDRESKRTSYNSKEVNLDPAMTNTVNALVELGYVTESDVAQWERDLAEWKAENLAGKDAAGIVYPQDAMVSVG